MKQRVWRQENCDLVTCQNLIVGAAGYGQRVRVWSVGVLDIWVQGSKTWLKLMCFALTAETGVSLDFRGDGVRSRGQNRVGRSIKT